MTQLARLRVGVVGVGSVGAVVAEILARTGIQEIVLIDFDHVESHNLDRLLHASRSDAEGARLKVEVCADTLRRNAISDDAKVTSVACGIHEFQGYAAALDCDVLFSCVDRPLPRHILNLLAQAHLIPVVDGGIFVRRSRNAGLLGADWRAHIVGPGRRCLACIGQYDTALVQADREGLLDDPSYLESLPDDHPIKQRQNVFAFSVHCAAMLVLQYVQMIVSPAGLSSPGRQLYHFGVGMLDSSHTPAGCDPHCMTSEHLAWGDLITPTLGLNGSSVAPRRDPFECPLLPVSTVSASAISIPVSDRPSDASESVAGD